MKIKTNFKEYYDYMGRVHGEDPNVTYVRMPHRGAKGSTHEYRQGKMVEVECEYKWFDVPAVNNLPVFRMPDPAYEKGWRVRTIYVCGVAYAVVGREATVRSGWATNPSRTVYERDGEDVPFTAFDVKHPFVGAFPQYAEQYLPIKHRSVDAMHKATGMPVFQLYDGLLWRTPPSGTTVDCQVPCLKDFDFGKVLSAEQIWQEIQYYLLNLINESPDMAPPPRPPQTNLEKLQSHGFDKRWSFRHRT